MVPIVLCGGVKRRMSLILRGGRASNAEQIKLMNCNLYVRDLDYPLKILYSRISYATRTPRTTKKVEFGRVNISRCPHAFIYARVVKANANEPEREECIGTLPMVNKEASRPILSIYGQQPASIYPEQSERRNISIFHYHNVYIVKDRWWDVRHRRA
ncbi:hypothetical protein NQ317_014843 [Molorchus minor]|uniref:Uncharacterized protein n=1 Tax=Molorchus minor TaxID=1323400 RepID=A0ABQ9JSE0_9CUCU|nr:hypothetical protein NQ317_014843 [Molorchus minor]